MESFKHNKNITININKKTMTDPSVLINKFNEYYVNVAGNTTKFSSIKESQSSDHENDRLAVENIVE